MSDAGSPGAFERAREGFLAGLRAFEAGDFADAALHFEASLAALPGRVSTLVNLAATRLKLAEPARALALLDAAIAQDPSQADAHHHRGRALAALGHDAEALRAFDQAILLAGGAGDDGRQQAQVHASASAERALALLALGHAGEALAQLDALPAGLAGRADTAWHRGRALQALERVADAEAAYRRAVGLDPGLAGAWGHLGGLLKDEGRGAEAVECLRRAQSLEPDEPVHAFLLASLGAAPAPAVPPAHYVRALFDGYADRFDQHLVQTLHYRAPEQLVALLAPLLRRDTEAPTLAVDLGCGTGLLGPLLAPHVGALDGVDLSPTMLASARRRGVYRHLHEAELVGWLSQAPARGRLDVLAATDVLIYLGDLGPLFRAAADALRPGGLFAFSVELLADTEDSGHGWQLRPTARYAHSRGGLRRWADPGEWTWVADAQAPVREEQRQPVPGMTVVLRRN